MAELDGRRRRYVPIDVTVAFGRFGTRLIDKWGMEGICTWLLFLAACKREQNEGTFTYTTDEEGWGKLGAQASGFTLDEFWRLTGQCKKTSRRRHGRVSYVICTVWGDWNTRPGAPRKPRSDGRNAEGLRENAEKYNDDVSPEVDLEVEVEVERDKNQGLAVVLDTTPARVETDGKPDFTLNTTTPKTIGQTIDESLAHSRKQAVA